MEIRRISARGDELKSYLLKSRNDIKHFEDAVTVIGNNVRMNGNKAIFEYNFKFDGAMINEENFLVSENEIDYAYDIVDDDFVFALRAAIDNIRDFHVKQLRTSWLEPDAYGSLLGQVFRPLERVGIYAPGGTAAYPSSVLMNAIPAQVAGVSEIAMVTPPNNEGAINPYTLVAAAELGLTEIYKMGGAHAIFALAWGTETVNKVDLISGPGNVYVTIAKKKVYGDVNIDMLAGPSEILIVADEKANPKYIAADLLSQAEHDVLARSILVTHCEPLLDEVEKELALQIPTLSRQDIINQSLKNYGAFIITEDLNHSCRVANEVAPEHLELLVEQPFSCLYKIHNAGAIFMGQHTPEPVGDYYAGPNHILPTGGTARFYSAVTVDTFRKASSIIYYSAKGLMNSAQDIIKLATVEGLTAHANSIEVRLK